MAISDLQGQLSKPEFKVDDATERRLCKVVLQQLDDGASDIAGLVVKWWAPCVWTCPAALQSHKQLSMGCCQ